MLGDLAVEGPDGVEIDIRRWTDTAALMAVLLREPGTWVSENDLAHRLDKEPGWSPRTVPGNTIRPKLGPACTPTTDRGRWRLSAEAVERDVDDCDRYLDDAEAALLDGRSTDAARNALAAHALFRGDPLAALVRRFPALDSIVEELEARRDRALAVLSLVRRDGVTDWRISRALTDGTTRRRDAAVQALADELVSGQPVLQPAPGPYSVGRQLLVNGITERLQAMRGARSVVTITGHVGVGKSHVLQMLTAALRPTVGRIITLDLRGIDDRPLDPRIARQNAVRQVRPSDVHSPAAYPALFTATSSERPTLLVLDHTDDAEQVRELLPDPEAHVIVLAAGLRRMTGLADAVVEIDVPPLDTDPALDLFTHATGRPLETAERGHAIRLVAALSGRPIALVIAGSKVGVGQSTVLECLDAVQQENVGFFNDSQLALAPLLEHALRRCTRLERRALAAVAELGLPSVDVELVACALNETRPAVRGALAGLTVRRQLDATPNGRWTAEPLVRGFARERLSTDAPPLAGLNRVLDDMIAAADQAGDRADPARITLQEPRTTHERGRDWFDTHRDDLVGLVGRARRHEDWDRCWRLAIAVDPLLGQRGGGPERRQVLDDADTAARSGPESERRTGWYLLRRADALRYDGQYDAARDRADEALRLLTDADDGLGAAAARLLGGDLRCGIAQAAKDPTGLADALTRAEQAAREFDALGHPGGRATSQELVGEILVLSGRADDGVHALDAAHRTYRRMGALRGEGKALRLLAATHRRSNPERAVSYADAALRAARRCDDTTEAARIQITLGIALRDLGRLSRADEVHGTAADYFEGVHDRRWLMVATAEHAATSKHVGPTTPWRSRAMRALDLAVELHDETYRQFCEDLLRDTR